MPASGAAGAKPAESLTETSATAVPPSAQYTGNGVERPAAHGAEARGFSDILDLPLPAPLELLSCAPRLFIARLAAQFGEHFLFVRLAVPFLRAGLSDICRRHSIILVLNLREGKGGK